MRRTGIRRPKELFLSHAHADRQFLSRLAKALRSHRIPYWYSKIHLLGAQQWHDEIGRALARCDWFLIVLSPKATKSEWVKRELVYALNEKKYRGKIVPVLLCQCKYNRLSWTLGEFQYIDFTKTFEAGCRMLLKSWGLPYLDSTAGSSPASRKTKTRGEKARFRRN
jgi:TIR domain